MGLKLNSRQSQVLVDIFAEPTRAGIAWTEIEALLEALGAEKINRKQKTGGSRVRYKLNGARGFFHRPHEKDACKGCVEDVRSFLMAAGIKP